jgi:hypothetical protein
MKTLLCFFSLYSSRFHFISFCYCLATFLSHASQDSRSFTKTPHMRHCSMWQNCSMSIVHSGTGGGTAHVSWEHSGPLQGVRTEKGTVPHQRQLAGSSTSSSISTSSYARRGCPKQSYQTKRTKPVWPDKCNGFNNMCTHHTIVEPCSRFCWFSRKKR